MHRSPYIHTIFCFDCKVRVTPALLLLHCILTCAETFSVAEPVLQWRVPWQEAFLLPDDTSILSCAYQSHLTSCRGKLRKHTLSGVNQGHKTNLQWSQTSEPDILGFIHLVLSVAAVHTKVASHASHRLTNCGVRPGAPRCRSPARMDWRLVTAPCPRCGAGAARGGPSFLSKARESSGGRAELWSETRVSFQAASRGMPRAHIWGTYFILPLALVSIAKPTKQK